MSERDDLVESLAAHRDFLLCTVEGLSDEQARRKTTVSELTLGGVVKHVAAMEKQWVEFILTGPDILVGGEKPATWTAERDPFLLETSVPGIFAAGDVRYGVVRRVASAVGQGSIAISMVHKYLETV